MASEEISLKNKIVLITGGTTGIGRATAVLLAKKGANVHIFGRSQSKLNDALRDIEKAGGRATGFSVDVSHIDELKKVFDHIDSEHGRIDVLINNAAVAVRSIIDTPIDDLKYSIEVNLSGYLYCAKFAAERMLNQGEGHIINIGSMSATTKDSETDLYVAAKSGIQGFNDSLRKLISEKCIKITLIEPGTVGTNMIDEPPEEQQQQENKLFMLKAEDIADVIVFSLTRPKRCDIVTIRLKPHRQNI